MWPIIAPFVCAVIVLYSTLSFAAKKLPAEGSYGFDWLQPDSARCQAVSEKLIKQFRQCEYNESGTFGLSDPAYACRISDHSEHLIYETKASCINNLETMQANTP